MKDIKVFLQSPWKFADSSYYKYLVDYPASNVSYVNKKKKFGVLGSAKGFMFANYAKKFVRDFTNKLNLPIPNVHKTKTDKEYDLIHCAHCLSSNKTPWVADIESAWNFWISGRRTFLGKYFVNKILLSDNCKKIMPWTKHTENNILKEIKGIKDKVELLYPAVPQFNFKRKKHKPSIIFVSRYFWIKGGLVALEVLSKLKSKYDLDVTFISEVPKEIKDKYKGIKFLDLVPQSKLFDYYYPKSDIFFYPSYVDTFGFSLLEAMSFGLPVVTVDNPTRKEIVTNNKTGFVVNRPKNIDYYKIGKNENKLIKDLVKKTSLLVENTSLRNKMSRNSLNIVRNGRFSIKTRNKQIRRIYEEALRF